MCSATAGPPSASGPHPQMPRLRSRSWFNSPPRELARETLGRRTGSAEDLECWHFRYSESSLVAIRRTGCQASGLQPEIDADDLDMGLGQTVEQVAREGLQRRRG